MRVVAILKDPKVLKAAVERRLLKLAERPSGWTTNTIDHRHT